jgi:hypothetical protein
MHTIDRKAAAIGKPLFVSRDLPLHRSIWGSAMATVDDMRLHITHLLAEVRESRFPIPDSFHVHWIDDRNEAIAITDDKPVELRIPTILTPEDYGTCLHGLAQLCVSDHESATNDVMARERAAWKWAREKALVWTSEMERDAQESLQWYLDHFRPERPALEDADMKGNPVKLAPLELGIHEVQPGKFIIFGFRDGPLTEQEASRVGLAYGVVYDLVNAGRLRILEDGEGRWRVQLTQS